MTSSSGPVQPVPLDARGQRRRTLATGAGIVAVAGIVVAGMALTHRPAGQPVTPGQPVGAAATASADPGPGAGPTTAAVTTTAAATAAVTTQARTTVPAATRVDVDGDGRDDTVSTTFVSKRTAKVVAHLASGETLTSKAFPLYDGDGAGAITATDVNGDHRAELLVSDPGADGTGYELFAYVRPSLVEVAAPQGEEQPFLYEGGGMYYQSSFGCTGDDLVITHERPDVASTASLPPDPRFALTTTTYALAAGRLTTVSAHTETVANRSAAAVVLARTANACGAQP